METNNNVKPRKKKRRIPAWAWGALFVLTLAGVSYGVDYMMSEGRVPRGVTVGGVDIGGMTPNQASQRLRNELGEDVRAPFTVEAGNMYSIIDPTQSGLQVDWAGTVEQAGKQPINPITRLTSFWQTREVGIVSTINDASLNRAVMRVERELTREASNAAITIDETGKGIITKDVPGQTVDRATVRQDVEKNWLNTDHVVETKANVVNAAIRTDSAEKLVKDIVEPATSAPLVFIGRNDVRGQIQAADMGRVLRFEEDGNNLRPIWDLEGAKGVLQPQLASTEVEFRNASFTEVGGNLSVVPHSDGVSIKWEDTLGDIQAKALDLVKRDHEVIYEDKKATYTTEMAQAASFNDVMGEFTTSGFSGPSGVNIRRVAEMVNGAIVLPGETFSLNRHTGPRGEAQGFVRSGIILDGQADNAVGGGISQFATTLYNASYFAGMDDVAHTPHSYYISRYPAGREATVFEGAIDLQFKNPFDTPARIEAFVSGNSVTVRLLGVKHVQVESIPGARTNITQPDRRTGSGPNCVPSSGGVGFTVTDTRVVKDLGGKELSRKTTTTKYDPQPIVTCNGGGAAAPAAPAPADAAPAAPAAPAVELPELPEITLPDINLGELLP